MSIECDLILPCRNEAAALPQVFASIPDGFRVIVVDNGSVDDTAEVALGLGATVVSESQPGYGSAIDAGLSRATAPFVAVMDADGSFDGADLEPLLALVVNGDCDLALGRRRPTSIGVWPWHARLGNGLIVWWLRHRWGFVARDLAPMRVCRRDALVGLAVADRRFGYPVELLQKAVQAGWRIAELPVTYGPRAAGTKSKVSGSVVGTMRAARDFARVLS
jgi:glycosyltransferase involved in cell wall biosynthesis